MNGDTTLRVLEATGARGLLSRVLPWAGLVCLNYHRIGSAAGSKFDWGLWSADEATFDAQLRFLKSACDVVGPGDLAAAVASGKGRYAMITFDDGYADNYQAAFPLLKHHRLTATFFVATGFIDRPRLPWWDEIAWMVRTSSRPGVALAGRLPNPIAFDEPHREGAVRALLRVYKGMPEAETGAYLDELAEESGSGRFAGASTGLWMTWDMLRAMQSAGMSIGGHTVNHPVLSRMPAARQGEEIDGCAGRLRTELGIPMECFSYPVGGRRAFDDDTQAHLRRAGVRYAFSYYGGYRTFDQWDDLDIRRVPIESDTHRARFRAIVTMPRLFARVRSR